LGKDTIVAFAKKMAQQVARALLKITKLTDNPEPAF